MVSARGHHLNLFNISSLTFNFNLKSTLDRRKEGHGEAENAKGRTLRHGLFDGAGEGIRTLDPNLGKVMLYP